MESIRIKPKSTEKRQIHIYRLCFAPCFPNSAHFHSISINIGKSGKKSNLISGWACQFDIRTIHISKRFHWLRAEIPSLKRERERERFGERERKIVRFWRLNTKFDGNISPKSLRKGNPRQISTKKRVWPSNVGLHSATWRNHTQLNIFKSRFRSIFAKHWMKTHISPMVCLMKRKYAGGTYAQRK